MPNYSHLSENAKKAVDWQVKTSERITGGRLPETSHLHDSEAKKASYDAQIEQRRAEKREEIARSPELRAIVARYNEVQAMETNYNVGTKSGPSIG